MRFKTPACVYARRRNSKSVSFAVIFALAVLAAAALVVGAQHPSVALAKGGANDGGAAGVGGGGNGLASLKTVAIPRPTNLARFVKDEQAAIALGKALFWDQQVGSDGQSCASCHFHAGADSRSKNQLDPGLRAVPPDPTFQLGGPNFQLKASDFPLHKLANPNDRNSAVLFDTNDIVSSQGVRNITFTNVIVGNTTDAGISIPDPIFSVNGVNVRRVEPRNTPTMINAVFNFRNFWDGRARNEFNGVDPIGNLDPGAKVLRVAAPGPAPQPGPKVECGCDNRRCHPIGMVGLEQCHPDHPGWQPHDPARRCSRGAEPVLDDGGQLLPHLGAFRPGIHGLAGLRQFPRGSVPGGQ